MLLEPWYCRNQVNAIIVHLQPLPSAMTIWGGRFIVIPVKGIFVEPSEGQLSRHESAFFGREDLGVSE